MLEKYRQKKKRRIKEEKPRTDSKEKTEKLV
jgi:hypothetical protein